jgi:hypothetical protein
MPTEMLQRGVLHEWFGVTDGGPPRPGGRSPWTPPLLILTHLARQGLDRAGCDHHVIWIGRRVWAHPRVLARGDGALHDDRRLLARSVFVDPPDDAARLWAIDVALRCPSVAVVVADGSRLDMAHTRRIQLAARRTRVLALAARPPSEITRLSAASLRWRVARAPARRPPPMRHRPGEPPGQPAGTPRWRIELLRCKGMQRAERATEAALMEPPLQSQWMLEWDRASGCIRPSSDVVDRPASTARAARDEAG